MVRRSVEDRLAASPTHGYHRGPSDVHADLIGRGHEQPEKTPAGAMRVPEETVHAAARRDDRDGCVGEPILERDGLEAWVLPRSKPLSPAAYSGCGSGSVISRRPRRARHPRIPAATAAPAQMIA